MTLLPKKKGRGFPPISDLGYVPRPRFLNEERAYSHFSGTPELDVSTYRTGPDVKFTLTPEVFEKMHIYAQLSEGEISGCGKVELIEDTESSLHIRIVDVMIFKQVVTPGHTTMNGEVLSRWYYELVKADQDPGEWKLWWHSHHTMPAFFSGEDHATIATLSEPGRMYSLCINKAGNMVARADKESNIIGTASIEIDHPINEELREQLRAQVEELVTLDKERYVGLPDEEEASGF
ncbi:MAG TPA: hypothetical protein VK141_08485 [Nitrosomonas sp.]|nr:hypothetical protein [Nitrosomonas sp.]